MAEMSQVSVNMFHGFPFESDLTPLKSDRLEAGSMHTRDFTVLHGDGLRNSAESERTGRAERDLGCGWTWAVGIQIRWDRMGWKATTRLCSA